MNNRLIQIAQNILLENEGDSSVKIPTNKSTPDDLRFDGIWKDWDESNGPFGFIGKGNGILVYDPNGYDGNHPTLFSNIANIERHHHTDFKGYLKRCRIKFFGNLTMDDILYAYDEQGFENIFYSMMKPRISSRAGRLWKKIKSVTLVREIDAMVFWCKESDIKKSDLASLKKNLKLKDFFWAASDSEFFNQYGAKESLGSNTKNLHSKQYPRLSHDEIVNILIKAHTAGTKLSPYEKDVVKEFRGSADVDDIINNMKKKTGGFPTMAQRNAAMWTSEETETQV